MQPNGNHEEPVSEPQQPLTRQEAQVQIILDAFGDSVERGPENWQEIGVEYLFRKDVLLIRAGFAAIARRLLRQGELLRAEEDPHMPAGTPRDDVDIRGFRAVYLRPGTSFAAVRLLQDYASDIAEHVALEMLVHTSGNVGICPADEPRPVPNGTPPNPAPIADRAAGAGVRVVVLDTGLDPAAPDRHWWLRGVTGDPDPLIQQTPLDPYAGHGTFIAGIVRCMAPRAEVIVRKAFEKVGAQFELELVKALDRALFEDQPDVISMSAGTLGNSVHGARFLREFCEERLRRHKGVALVVAAGNDGRRQHFWPAASPETVSVGALDVDWRSRADFSNFGTWVDVYAPGKDLINAFVTGDYQYREPPLAGTTRHFDGMALWSGTSFSTPLVAGLIAARMSRTGESARDAAAALLAQARAAAIPGVGAVLVPPVG
jgi:hypothetical protein